MFIVESDSGTAITLGQTYLTTEGRRSRSHAMIFDLIVK